jgi:hypothetical protein
MSEAAEIDSCDKHAISEAGREILGEHFSVGELVSVDVEHPHVRAATMGKTVGPQKVHYFSDRRAPVTVRILRNGKVAVATSAEITEARFQLDEPSGVVNQLTHVTVNEVPATMFFGSNSVMGDTREIWFIRGFLYEVTTYKEFDSWLTPIMQTWQFTP